MLAVERVSRYEIHPASDLRPIGAIYREVGFRPDLVDDLPLLQALGGSVFVATDDDEVVGVATCLPFARTGWIGGVAVTPAHGGRGLGSRLTEAAMGTLADRGAETMLLQATEAAQQLYERLGFVPETQFAELRGHPGPMPAPAGSLVREGAPADLEAVLALDREATGEDRGRLLAALWPRDALVAEASGSVVGFALAQSASAVGAVVAADPAAGEALLAAAIASRPDSPRVGVPVAHEQALGLLLRAGYDEKLRTTRMHVGTPPEWAPERIFATFNLYWG
jgi:predicted N-acetyltransferase YhbS